MCTSFFVQDLNRCKKIDMLELCFLCLFNDSNVGSLMMNVKKSLKILAAAFGSFLGMGALAGCDETTNDNDAKLDGVYCNGKYYESADDPGYLACRGINCCGNHYESATDPDYLACIQEAANNGCGNAVLYGMPSTYCCGTTYDSVQDPGYQACIREAQANGCQPAVLYGPISQYECCGTVYASAQDPDYLACLRDAANNDCVVAEYGMPVAYECCDVEYASDQAPDYLACIKNAAQNGCYEIALYGVPSTLPCCGQEYDINTNAYIACKVLEDYNLCDVLTHYEDVSCDWDVPPCCGHQYKCNTDELIEASACRIQEAKDLCEDVPPPQRND